MSAIGRMREADKSLAAAIAKMKQLCDIEDGKAFVEASRRHSTMKAYQFAKEAHELLPRCACGRVTDLACSDCRINRGIAVYVCESHDCRTTHETAAACTPGAAIDWHNCVCNPRLSGHTVDPKDGRHYKPRKYQTR